MGALDQVRATGRRVGAVRKRARWTVADAGKRASEAVSRAGKSVAAAPARAFARIRSDTDSAGRSQALSETEGATKPSARWRMTARIRENPFVSVAIVGGALLVCAWIAFGWST